MAKSTAGRDIPLIVIQAIALTVIVFTALFLVLDLE